MFSFSDWRMAVRMFIRQPGLTAAAVVALALGVALTTLLFSIGYGIFLRGLPVPEGDRIMAVTISSIGTGQRKLGVGIHDYEDWRVAQRSFESLAAVRFASLNVVAREGQPERLRGAFMSGDGFGVLRVQPLLGRTLLPDDATPGARPVLVLGHGAWTTWFGADQQVIGRTVRADGQPATIVGVMPKGFAFPESQEAWMALQTDPLALPRGSGPTQLLYGRLRPGVGPASAQADLGAIAARLAQQHPDTNRNLVPVVRPYTEAMGSDDENAVFFMVLIVGLGFGVLLVACANVSNLLLARAVARTRDTALRAALGAGRRRLVTQMLAETAVLALGGTLVGLLLAQAGIVWFNRSIVNLNPPFWVKVGLDGAALAFAAGLTGVSAIVSGLVPAWRASRGDISGLLKDGARSGSMRLGRASRVLVMGEIAMSFALLVMAGLMSRSIVNLGTHRYGFAMENIFTARVALPEQQYSDSASRARFATALADRVAALPGVRSATLASALPGLSADRAPVAIDGRVYQDASEFSVVRTAVIGPHYFETFYRALVRGRDFTTADDDQAPRVVIVNASFAERYFPGGEPVGRRVRLGRDGPAPWATIVGIAPDLYMGGAEDRDRAGLYVPIAQGQARTFSIAVQAAGAPLALTASVRAQIAALDPDLPLYLPDTLRAAVDATLWGYRVFGPLLVVVGVASLFLATVGLASLMSFATRQRTAEIGLRMALGAHPSHVARLVAGQVTMEVAIGLVVGGALGAALAQASRAMLFHVQPGDPATYAAIVATLTIAAAAAAWRPVHHAIRVDPVVALRDE
jgi:putative ABC transport system permease protein